jgi:hypothetical protein
MTDTVPCRRRAMRAAEAARTASEPGGKIDNAPPVAEPVAQLNPNYAPICQPVDLSGGSTAAALREIEALGPVADKPGPVAYLGPPRAAPPGIDGPKRGPGRPKKVR